jgi:cellulose synthase/poly-beta-1,6-N-acetylglucosamine synthase-like glycosyltransferase
MAKLTFTVAISTRRAPESILITADSIIASIPRRNIEVLIYIIADRFEDPVLKNKLIQKGIKLIEVGSDATLPQKFKYLFKRIKTDILIFTQDDIRFAPDTIKKIVKTFKTDKETTLVCTKVESLPARNFFEKVVQVGTRLNYRIGEKWGNRNNYLLCNGRCMGFRTSFCKKYRVPEGVVNLDAYFYFENKRVGGIFKYLRSAVVYNKVPSNFNEHLKQSSRFQNSFLELSRYLGSEKLNYEYNAPFKLIVLALLEELFYNPIESLSYLGIFIITRVLRIGEKKSINPLWSPDLSTKIL